MNEYWHSRVVFSPQQNRHIPVTYVTHEGKDYQQLVKEALLANRKWFRSKNPIALKILVCPDSQRRQDISNRIKVLEDALQNGNLFEDDSQVELIEVRRGPIFTPAVVVLRVEEILPDRQAGLHWIKQPVRL